MARARPQKRRPHDGATDQEPGCYGRQLENAGIERRRNPGKRRAARRRHHLSFAVWQARKAEIISCHKRIGLLLQPDDRVEEVAGDLDYFIVIAVSFPKFVDGRGYSTASLLRQRYKFQGELRAVGDVLHDQLFFMQRVGFDTYALKDGKSAAHAISNGFSVFADAYQTASDQPQPYFRRRAA